MVVVLGGYIVHLCACLFVFYTDTTNTYIKQQEATDILIGPDYIQTGKQ